MAMMAKVGANTKGSVPPDRRAVVRLPKAVTQVRARMVAVTAVTAAVVLALLAAALAAVVTLAAVVATAALVSKKLVVVVAPATPMPLIAPTLHLLPGVLA
jgi:hypothetical protein